ncbi:MAG: ribbon-helix-helix domain-containing protein [Gallionella sp.]|nr:ribbon-helix-helix domain-containing protein [Gallionella sp.]MCK9353987.1 ribbon-helix-helix domain-containing protein [Gallionella sp.]
MTTTINLPQSVIERLEKIAASSRRTPEALAKQAINDRLDYEEWKAKKVRASIESAKAGKVFGKEEFWTQLAKARNARKKAA